VSEEWETRHSLLIRAKDPSNEEAWAEFVTYYEKFIYHLLHRLNINADDFYDLVQDILVKLWKNLNSYEERRAKFRSWLAFVVRNTVYDYFDREKRRNKALRREHEIANHLRETPVTEVEAMIEKEWIIYVTDLAMQRMEKVFSGKAIRVFSLSLDGMSIEQIAEQLNLQKTSVYTLRNRVKARYIKEIHALMGQLER
jgi:RNA polymerase sigma factor (sigma-70 family)